MNIVIAGTGAMGATYGALLTQANHEVHFLDGWQENIDAINQNGIHLHNVDRDEIISARCSKPQDYQGQPDLIIVFTKSMQLDSMMQNIKHLIHPNTSVLCLLNGLGHIETLKRYVNEDQIIMGVTVLTAGMSGPGHFSCSAHGKTEIQNIGAGGADKARAVATALTEATLPTEYSENVLFSIWRKACLNGTMNANCALLDCNMISLGGIPNLKLLLKTIVSEFASVAALEGVHLDIQEITDYVTWFTTKDFAGSNHHPSMHQDLILHHRYTEIDFLNGYVARKAREAGSQAPYCELITLYVHAKEKLLIEDTKEVQA